MDWAQISYGKCLLAWMLETPRRGEKWWEAKAFCPIWSFSCLRKLKELTSQSLPLHPVHTRNNHEMVAYLYSTSSKEGVKTADCIGLSLDSCFFVFWMTVWETDAVLTKRAVFVNKNRNRRIQSFAPKKLLWVLTQERKKWMKECVSIVTDLNSK